MCLQSASWLVTAKPQPLNAPGIPWEPGPSPEGQRTCPWLQLPTAWRVIPYGYGVTTYSCSGFGAAGYGAIGVSGRDRSSDSKLETALPKSPI